MTSERAIPDAAEMDRYGGLRDTPHRARLLRVMDRVAPFGMLRSELFDCVFDIEAAALAATPAPDPGAGLREALWQCGVESGMDTDGDDGPGAMIAGMGDAGFAAAMVEQVRQLRRDYDECLAPSAEPPETEP